MLRVKMKRKCDQEIGDKTRDSEQEVMMVPGKEEAKLPFRGARKEQVI
jgi:hypothetical protein